MGSHFSLSILGSKEPLLFLNNTSAASSPMILFHRDPLYSAKNRGPFPAIGKSFKVTIIGIHRIAKGKIAETWVTWDNVAWLTQIGHFPHPP
jgi:hypothetical protein